MPASAAAMARRGALNSGRKGSMSIPFSARAGPISAIRTAERYRLLSS